MRALITGADGFIGKNLRLRLNERDDVELVSFTREHDRGQLLGLLREVDVVFHLAGINRPQDPGEFATGNADLTRALCEAMIDTGRQIRVIYSSSTQAARDNPYGLSKREAERALFRFRERSGSPVHVFRLPNVFGKWCRPNYNSAVATFCYNIARGIPIQVNDAAAGLTLAYVDDVVERFVQLMDGAAPCLDAEGFECLAPQYTTTVGAIAEQIEAFKAVRTSLVTERVGSGLTRALYATYVSYLPPDAFSYDVARHGDPRGVFVEFLKTPDCGQFSYFTAGPGVTRGGHYHHSKTEKFLILKGRGRFRFRHMHTGEAFELVTDDTMARIVETVPGWTHDITNIGDDEMVVMLWANEIFDRARPDTYARPL
jgi:UDP-2-acetamido-2,6-beta-L-arabino-hexul-4-ose reductase